MGWGQGKEEAGDIYGERIMQSFDENAALEILSEDEVRFHADMRRGDQEATAWGCDLTYDYVKINGDYRS